MRTKSIFLILFFTANLIHAQTTTGISVQGIARDATKAAISGQALNFVFTVSGTPSGGSLKTYYKETQDITTDAFGVFSHIIGTGTPAGGSGAFADVHFGEAHMSLKVEANSVVLLDGPLQYAPYAKSADYANNGVPVGGVIMWSGEVTKIPAGWALCDGNNSTPDLRGRFVVGYKAGNPDYAMNFTGGEEKHALTVDELASHSHTATIANAGAHNHTYNWYEGTGSATPAGIGDPNNSHTRNTNTAGDHTHSISINSTGSGVAHENRPPYYALAYIMRLK